MLVFNTFVKGYLWGTALFPVEAYVVYRFGGTLWQDIKVLAYSLWDKFKAKV